MGKIGHIKALEVTHGRNGWHPHYHILIFTKQELPKDYDTAPLLELWQNSCRLAKLPIQTKIRIKLEKRRLFWLYFQMGH